MRNIIIFIGVILLSFIALKVISEEVSPIYCPLNKTHLYNYKGEILDKREVKAEDFIPVGNIKQPTEEDSFECPFCGTSLNGYISWFKMRGYDPPKLMYPVITMLTKDKDGNFVWKPYPLEFGL